MSFKETSPPTAAEFTGDLTSAPPGIVPRCGIVLSEALTHQHVDASLVSVHAPVCPQLCGESRQDHLAHHVGEYRGSPCDFAETVLVRPSAGPGAEAVTPETPLVEDVEQLGSIGHESGWFLAGVPALGFLPVHTLVSAYALHPP